MPRRNRTNGLTPKMLAALAVWDLAATYAENARRAGVTKQTVSLWMKDDRWLRALDTMEAEIVKQCARTLAKAVQPASQALLAAAEVESQTWQAVRDAGGVVKELPDGATINASKTVLQGLGQLKEHHRHGVEESQLGAFADRLRARRAERDGNGPEEESNAGALVKPKLAIEAKEVPEDVDTGGS